MSIWTCGLKAFGRKREEKMLAKDKNLIAERMERLANDWDTGKFKNVKDAKWNNHDVWERLYSEYSDEIEVINKTKQMYESVSQHEIGIQKYDLSLKISI